jgi:two-component system phosphate regulon response regulator PhoB
MLFCYDTSGDTAMGKEMIWAVDDEEDILELLRYNLLREGFQIRCFGTGEEIIEAGKQEIPDILLLDLMLPGIGGLDVCRYFRQTEAMRHVPIIMLTAKGEEADIVSGLELGADDYITKPFSPRILAARIRAVLRRRQEIPVSDAVSIKAGEMTIHPGRFSVQTHQEMIDLTQTEFRILHFLARKPGWVYTRGQIVDAVHGMDHAVTERSIDVQIAGLRRKLGPLGDWIETVRGIGYRFKEAL